MGDFLTLRERTDKAAEAIGKFFDPRGGMIANTPVTAEDAGVWINVREARELLAVVEAAQALVEDLGTDPLDTVSGPVVCKSADGVEGVMTIFPIGSYHDLRDALRSQDALTVRSETHRTTEGK